MTRWCLVLLVITAPLLVGWRLIERAEKDVALGNRAYEAGHFNEALSHYRRALGGDANSAVLQYDLGTALYRLAEEEEDPAQAKELLDRAAAAFQQATSSADRRVRVAAFYNLGNALYQAERFEDAISSYRRALRLEPGLEDARHNLELALRRRDQEIAAKRAAGAGQPQSAEPNTEEFLEALAASAAEASADDGPGESAPGEAEQADEAPPAENPADDDSAEHDTEEQEAPTTSPPPRSARSQSIQDKLEALERRSSQLRRQRLRARTSQQAAGATSGKDQ